MGIKPTVLGSVVDTNSATIALTGDKYTLIRYHSNAKATMYANAKEPGASIDENLYIIRNGDRTGYGREYTFNNVEDGHFRFSAEDSMGNVGTYTLDVPLIDYQKLTCYLGDDRPDGDGKITLTCSGLFFNGSFGAVDNTLTVKCRYKPYGGSYSAWTNMSVSCGAYGGASDYTASAQLTGLDYQNSYSFEVMATDLLETATVSTEGVRSTPIFHWGGGDFQFEVPVEMHEHAVIWDDLSVGGNVSLGGEIMMNNGGIWYGDDNSTCFYGTANHSLTLKAPQINLLSDTINLNGAIIERGTWTPEVAIGNSPTTQQGWYTKIGKVVTVGFFVKTNCASGYELFPIMIAGLPFIPWCAAAGGGMCSGAYVSAGFNFQCFVAETTGNITTRVQACNNTAAANLATSASGCKYPTGGGELTVSGTITYMTA